MEYLFMNAEEYGIYSKWLAKMSAIRSAITSSTQNGEVYHVLKLVATITPKGVTVDDHEKEEV